MLVFDNNFVNLGIGASARMGSVSIYIGTAEWCHVEQCTRAGQLCAVSTNTRQRIKSSAHCHRCDCMPVAIETTRSGVTRQIATTATDHADDGRT